MKVRKKKLFLLAIILLFGYPVSRTYPVIISGGFSDPDVSTIDIAQPVPSNSDSQGSDLFDEIASLDTSVLLPEEEFNAWLNENFPDLPTQENLENIESYLDSIQNLNSKISELLPEIEAHLEITRTELETEPENVEELQDYLDRLTQAKNFLQETQQKIETQTQEIIENLSSKIESEEEFKQLLELTDAEIQIFSIFPASTREELEDIVTEKLEDKSNYYQKILSIFQNLEEDETLSEIKTRLSGYIDEINSRLTTIQNIDDYPFPVVYTSEVKEPQSAIARVGEFLNQWNNLGNLSPEEINNLKASIQLYSEFLNQFQLGDSELALLSEAQEAVNLELLDQLRERGETQEYQALNDLWDKLSKFKSNLEKWQEWIPKITTALDAINSGLEEILTHDLGEDALSALISKINIQAISALSDGELNLDIYNLSVEQILENLGVENEEEFNSLLQEIKDMIAVYSLLPSSLRGIGVNSLSGYIENLIYSKYKKYEETYKELEKIAAINPKISKILNILERYQSALIDFGEHLITDPNSLMGMFNSTQNLSPVDDQVLTDLQRIVNGEAGWEDLLQDLMETSALKNVLRILTGIAQDPDFDFSDAFFLGVTTKILNQIKDALNRALNIYLSPQKIENILSQVSYLRENEKFNQAFAYLDKLVTVLHQGEEEVAHIKSVIENLLGAVNTLGEATEKGQDIGNENRSLSQLNSELEELNSEIKAYEDFRRNLPPEDAEELDALLEELYQQRDSLKEQISELEAEIETLHGELTDLLQSAEEQVSSLNSPSVTVQGQGASSPPAEETPPDSPNPGENPAETSTPQGNPVPAVETQSQPTPSSPNDTSDSSELDSLSSSEPSLYSQDPSPQDSSPYLTPESLETGSTFNIETQSQPIPSSPNNISDSSGLDSSDIPSSPNDSSSNSFNNENFNFSEGLEGIKEKLVASLSKNYLNSESESSGIFDKETGKEDNNGEIRKPTTGILETTKSTAEIMNIMAYRGKMTEKIRDGEEVAQFVGRLVYAAKSDKETPSKEGKTEFRQLLENAIAQGNLVVDKAEENLKNIVENLDWENVVVLNGGNIFEAINKSIIQSFEGYFKEIYGKDCKVVLMGIVHDINRGLTLLVFEITTADGEKQIVIKNADSIVYINSKDPKEIIKAIIKQILYGNKKVNNLVLNRIVLLVSVLGILCLLIGVCLAIIYTRFQLLKYPIFKETNKERAKYALFSLKSARKKVAELP